jgi:hypothetical protein
MLIYYRVVAAETRRGTSRAERNGVGEAKGRGASGGKVRK